MTNFTAFIDGCLGEPWRDDEDVDDYKTGNILWVVRMEDGRIEISLTE